MKVMGKRLDVVISGEFQICLIPSIYEFNICGAHNSQIHRTFSDV